MRWPLMVVVLLAGCVTTGPSVSPVGEFPPTPEPGQGSDAPGHVSEELANSTIGLGLDTVKVGVAVPRGALDVAYYLTTESGASYGIEGDLDGCVRRVDGPLLPGQTAGKSCGPLSEGFKELRVRHDAGSASVRVVVNATVRPCAATTPPSCPPAPDASGP